jgi:bifunctional NMN adenylyltransferase/nudix hydrolase
MKRKEDPLADVGVIVGRFQVHELTEAHISLIQSVCGMHTKVLIFLGLSPTRVTRNNPLDFESRKQMILEKFPAVNVLYIKDQKSDEEWSKNLDQQISDLTGPGQTVVLYGSRDCFISHYTGKYKTEELVQEVFTSGTETRKSISKKVKNTPEFRAGVIWAAYNQYPKVWPTVDIAILNEDETKVLLARKPGEAEYRFVGGFAEPKSESYEEDARREVMEEAGIDVTDPVYLSSFNVRDWRYTQEIDKIKTLFFVCKYISGRPQANDDVCEVRWFDLRDFVKSVDNIVENHKPMMEMLVTKYAL